jgi:tetratricopeptide (TPR) repeat protein
VPEYSAADALEVLVDTHLLESTAPDRYRFHDLLRVYASERAMADLPAQDRTAALDRLLGWYMRTADAAGLAASPPFRYSLPLDTPDDAAAPLSFTGAEDAFAWYESERANLVAATRQAAAAGLHEIAWRLPAPLFLIFNSRGNWAECITTHRVALDSVRQVGNRRGEAWVLNNLGNALGVTRDPEGIAHLERSIAIRHEMADRLGEGQATNNLADAYQHMGRADEALDLYRRGLYLNREAGNRYGEGVVLGNLGSTLLDLGRAEEAVDYLLQARGTFAAIGYTDGVGYALHILGRCHLSLGHGADALDCLRQALASHRAAGSRPAQAATLKSLGNAQHWMGLTGQAQESRTEAAAIFEELGDTAQAAELRAEQPASAVS